MKLKSKVPLGWMVSAGLLLLMSILIQGCYYDKADLVYPTAGPCDTTAVTYSKTIVSILTANKCFDCHSGSATAGNGIKLDTHPALFIQVNNGKLMGSIEQRNGYSAMPKGGAKLQSCDIAKIRTWVRAGALNN